MTAVLALFFLAAGSPEQRAWTTWRAKCRDGRGRTIASPATTTATAPERSTWLDGRGTPFRKAPWRTPAGGSRSRATGTTTTATPGSADTKLARIQFAAALAEGMKDRQALVAAAESLLPYLRGVLERAGRTRFAAPIARADRWFLAATPGNLLDTSVLLLAMPDSEDLKRNQTTDSGWGPQPNRPAEVFDTAIALMALQAVGETKPISRGRAYGVGSLRTTNDGPETTVILFHVKQRE